MSTRWAGTVAATGISCLLVSWSGSNPGGAMSDEPDQYLKAIAAGQGDLLGKRVSASEARTMDFWLPRLRSTLLAYPAYAELAREFSIPSSLDPRYLGCTYLNDRASCLLRKPPASSAGQESFVSSLGSYQPFVYIPAGLVMRFATDTTGALLSGRLVFAVLSALLILGAITVALRSWPGRLTLPSVILAVTPTAILCMADLSSNGAEIAGGIAWWVALLAVTERPASRLAWLLFAAGGIVLALSRSTGPVWIVLSTVLVMLVL